MTENRILDALARGEGRLLRCKDIARDLRADDPEDLERLDEILERLAADGRILRVRGRRYGRPDPDRIVIGHVQMKRRRPGARRGGEFAFVLPTSDEGEDVYVSARDLFGALDGDLVSVALKRQRGRPGPRRRGRVAEVIRRANERVTGVFEAGGTADTGRVVPDNDRLHFAVEIEAGRTGGAQDGEKVIARITRFPEGEGLARGEIAERLGPSGTWRAELAAIVERHGLRTEFPAAALREAAQLPGAIPDQERRCRADHTGRLTVTIDPDGAMDHDDAIGVERGEDGGWTLHVHIADVSYWVREDGAIDKETRRRGTSVYLPGRHLPMIPPRLSGELCSLHEGVDRLAITVTIRFDEDGVPRATRIERSVIRSDRSLSYRGVRATMDDAGTDDTPRSGPLLAMLGEARALSQRLRRRRMDAGSLDLDMPEVELELDDAGEVAGVHLRTYDWTHQLVEEFMLAANRAIAEYAVTNEVPCLYRVHEDPEEEAIEDLARFATALGFPLKPPHTRKKLQTMLAASAGSPQGGALRYALLRSLKKALYRPRCDGHFALHFARYCHFTSPIRRYPDLLVHRELARRFPAGEPILPPGRRGGRDGTRADGHGLLTPVAQHCSRMERAAEAAEREAVEFRQLAYLKGIDTVAFDGTVSDVGPYGIFVELAGFTVRGRVAIEDLPDDEYEYDATGRKLRGRRRTNVYRLGDPIRVRVRALDPGARRLDLELELPEGTPRAGRPAPRRVRGERGARGGPRKSRRRG